MMEIILQGKSLKVRLEQELSTDVSGLPQRDDVLLMDNGKALVYNDGWAPLYLTIETFNRLRDIALGNPVVELVTIKDVDVDKTAVEEKYNSFITNLK